MPVQPPEEEEEEEPELPEVPYEPETRGERRRRRRRERRARLERRPAPGRPPEEFRRAMDRFSGAPARGRAPEKNARRFAADGPVSGEDARFAARRLGLPEDLRGAVGGRDLASRLQTWRFAIQVERAEHGRAAGPRLNVTDDRVLDTARIALAHLREDRLYYHRLWEMEGSHPARGLVPGRLSERDHVDLQLGDWDDEGDRRFWIDWPGLGREQYQWKGF